MEQQKVLWIIFSVALFILVVVGVGVIWFLPGDHQAPKTAATATNSNAKIVFDPYEWAKSDNSTYPGLEGPQPQEPQQPNKDFTIIYGQNPPAATGAAPTTSSPAAATQAPSPAPSAPQPAPRVSAPAQRPAAATAARPARPAHVEEHWIQAASYTSNFRAEQAKKLLGEKGISSRIVSHVVSGTTYFRVRVGPYANQEEAQKYLSLVKQIGGFENSFLTFDVRSE